MHLSAFEYHLPEHLIAQESAERRDASRLLVLRRTREGSPAGIAHHVFSDLPGLLSPGDLLVLNDTRVVAARLVGRRARTEGKWEGLFVREQPDGTWELLVQTRGRLLVGETLLVDSPGATDELRLVLIGKTPSGRWLVRPSVHGPVGTVLARHGQVPIPPYIRKGRANDEDSQRYQTVFARHEGAVAAPTAGLHFTPEVFAQLSARGIEYAFVTLHVGPGTFQPVKVEDVSQHRVEPEWGELPDATTAAIASCKARGGRVVAVGTTSVRLLETAALSLASPGSNKPEAQAKERSTSPSLALQACGERAPGLPAWSGLCDLTISPPFTFRVVDALVTNFHLPRSSLLLLVAAFAGLDAVRAAYAEAVERQYRFYSYGDAMLIL
jgi:S-adenosylmethionine:tRNA ribosyltransferase-isomerase